MLDIDHYWPANQTWLAGRLVQVTEHLCELSEQYRDSLVQRQSTYYHTFQTSQATSIAGKEREAEQASFAEWSALQDVKCEIIAYEHERTLLLRLLDVTNAGG